MILKIVKTPDPILETKTAPVKEITPEILKLVRDMIDTCRKAQGIGLAAPQIGKSIRLCIINLEHLGLPPFALVNPKIVKTSWKKADMEEGCLSIPGLYGMVKRPAKVTVEAMNIEGNKTKFEADGILARVLQHEIDHLDGVLFTSKMSTQTSGEPLEQM
jgi:peptide deformylase